MSDTSPDIEVIEHASIPMPDGCRLSARIWLPEGARDRPVPAVLEYIPYRKRDLKRVRDSVIHGHFAQRGYAAVRLDLRGSGDSEGILRDEYLQQELDDGLEALRWIAAQPWCDGNIGMIGISWGGFNGLQIAAMQPPELKAIVSVCSSDDRYADDVHYMGGCLLTDNLSWASTMFAYNSCPPDPALVGERWKDMWLERLEGSGLWIHQWLQHQRRDDYWRHASVCEDYSAIASPVFVVSGWSDGYTNTVFRLLEHLEVPRKGLVGAWGHNYPHDAQPGPSIDFLGACVRWWDRWLKGERNGVDDEPMLTMWMQHAVAPTSPERPGRWIAEEDWPSPRIEERAYLINPRGVLAPADHAEPVELEDWVQSPLSVGLFAGKWCSYSAQTDLPSDQREEDGGALVFDTPPLEDTVEICGTPSVELELASDKPVAMVAARLSDVAPDGKATRVTFGLLNLAHRDSHAAPEPLEPGRRYRVRVPLSYVAQRFDAYHRIRVSLSSSYWPLAWPSPEPARLSVYTGASRLVLPTRPPRPEDRELRFDPPDGAEPTPTTMLAPAEREWTVVHDLAANRSTLNGVKSDPHVRLEDIDLEIYKGAEEHYSYYNYNYDTVRGEVVGRRIFRRGDWRVETVTRTLLTSTRAHFRVRATLDAYEGDTRVFSKSWDETIPRDQM